MKQIFWVLGLLIFLSANATSQVRWSQTNAEGVALKDSGENVAALVKFKEALVAGTELPAGHLGLAVTYSELAGLYAELGDFFNARELRARALSAVVLAEGLEGPSVESYLSEFRKSQKAYKGSPLEEEPLKLTLEHLPYDGKRLYAELYGLNLPEGVSPELRQRRDELLAQNETVSSTRIPEFPEPGPSNLNRAD